MGNELELEYYARLNNGDIKLDQFVTDLFQNWDEDKRQIIVEAGKKLGPTSKMRVREIVSSSGTNYWFCVKTNLKNSGPDGLKTRMEKEHEVMKETFDEFCSSVSDGTTKRLRLTSKPVDVVVNFSDGKRQKIKQVQLEYDIFFDKEDLPIPYVKIDVELGHSEITTKVILDKGSLFDIEFSTSIVDLDSLFIGGDASMKDLKTNIWKMYKGEGVEDGN